MAGTLYCCECNLCSLYSCPENLDPKNVCAFAKPVAREMNLVWSGTPDSVEPHPLAADRRVPMPRLIVKLGLAEFHNVGPLVDAAVDAAARRAAAQAARGRAGRARWSSRGDRVSVGDLVAAPAAGALGARIHASIAGVSGASRMPW